MFTITSKFPFGLARRSERGFTLIEMMVVIAIIGGLVALIISRYTHPLAVGQAGAIQMELKQIATALDTYNVDKGAYPATGAVAPALFGGASNQYMNNTPTTTGGVGYAYTAPAAGADYLVCTASTVSDGSAIPSLKKTDGTSPAAGTAYKLCYSPTYGIYAN